MQTFLPGIRYSVYIFSSDMLETCKAALSSSVVSLAVEFCFYLSDRWDGTAVSNPFNYTY